VPRSEELDFFSNVGQHYACEFKSYQKSSISFKVFTHPTVFILKYISSTSPQLTVDYISIYHTNMPHVSQRILDSRTKRQIQQTFELVLGKMNKDETNIFLFSILSETERLMLAKRLAIAVLLNEGVDQSSISEALCVTREYRSWAYETTSRF